MYACIYASLPDARFVGDIGFLDPALPVEERLHRELRSLTVAYVCFQPLPIDPVLRVGPGTVVHVLGVVDRARGGVAGPGQPPLGVDEPPHERGHVHRSRVDLPWPPEVGPHVPQVPGGPEDGALDGDPGVLVRVAPALGGNCVLLALHRDLGPYVAVLQHNRRVPEDEVDRPVDVALPVELAVRVGIQCVLEGIELAPVEHRLVRCRHQRHRLMFARPRRVAEPHLACNKAFPENGYSKSIIQVSQIIHCEE